MNENLKNEVINELEKSINQLNQLRSKIKESKKRASYFEFMHLVELYNECVNCTDVDLEKSGYMWGMDTDLFYWVASEEGKLEKRFFKNLNKAERSANDVLFDEYIEALEEYREEYKINPERYEAENFLFRGTPWLDKEGLWIIDYGL